jgi:hypothetical protein
MSTAPEFIPLTGEPTKVKSKVPDFIPLGEGSPTTRLDLSKYKVSQDDPSLNRRGWDKRADGSDKGSGFLGLLKRPDGRVSGEISIGVEINGKEVEIPTMVPTLSQKELDYLMTHDIGKGAKIPQSIVNKATAFAKQRIAAGKSPFAGDNEVKPPAVQPSKYTYGLEMPKLSITASSVGQAVKNSWDYWKQNLDTPMHQLSTIAGGAKAIVGSSKWMAEKAIEGITGIVMAKGWGYDRESASAAAQKVHSVLEAIDTAPANEQEARVENLLGLIGEVPGVSGETVFDKTGNALAAAGAETFATLLLLSPAIAAKVLDGVGKPLITEISGEEHVPKVARKGVSPEAVPKPDTAVRSGSTGIEKPNKVSAAFAALAAKQPDTAEAIAVHVGQVNPKLEKYMKEQVKTAITASNKDLKEIGRKSVEADVLTIKGKAVDPKPTGELTDVQRHAAMLQRMTPEQVSSSIRSAAKEGTEAIEKAGFEVVGKTPEGKPRVREKTLDEPGDPDIVFFNMGLPITRAHIEKAFSLTADVLRRVPGIPIAQGKLESLYSSLIETFNPEAKGAPARTAGAAIASNFFEQSHREHVVWKQGKVRRNYWLKMGKEAGIQFINKFEKGGAFDNPLWETARQGYKNWARQIFQQDMRTGFTYDPIDHYMPHLFKDAEGAIKALTKKYGNKWADPRFIHERGFDLYEEARLEGLKLEAQGRPNPFIPKYTSPEEIMQARQMASDIAALRTDLLADLERKGVARKALKGEDKPPNGFSPNSRRSPAGQRYWVREEADALMHNAFDSKSLWNDTGATGIRKLAGPPFRGFMELKNKIIPIKLALSAFHPMHVIHIDAAAQMTRASKRLASDAPTLAKARNFMLDMATSIPFTPGSLYRSLWDNPKTGYPVLRVFQGKRDFASLSDADKAAYKDLAEGGLVPTRPREEISGSMQLFADAVHRRSATALWHLPWAAVASLGHPIYNLWIPSLKIASYLKDVKVARELNPDWTPNARQEAFRQIARKVEARYGQMNYNTLFMDKTLKDIGVATNLSLGWNLGLLDQYAGGAIDLGRAVVEKGSVKEKVASGLLDRPIMAAYYVSSALMVGGLLHYYFTGKQPQQLIDYTHPESGENDQFGKPIRLNTMFYTREFEGLYKHIQQQGAVEGVEDFVLNKGSGIFEMAKSGLTGIDSLGQEIRRPEDPAYKQLEQTLLSEFAGIEPISLEAIQKSTGSPVKMGVLSGLGFIPAGKYISETVIEGRIATAYGRYVRPKETSYDRVAYSKDVKALQKAYTKDSPEYDKLMDAAQDKYDLKADDIRRLEKQFRREDEFDPSVYQFSRLDWQHQKVLLDQMTPEEREKYLPHSSKKHLRDNYEAPVAR